MKKRFLAMSVAAVVAAVPAFAHYGMIIPDDPMISQKDGRSVSLTMSFSHPFEMDGMMLERPVAFGVTHDGETTDLLDRISGKSDVECSARVFGGLTRRH